MKTSRVALLVLAAAGGCADAAPDSPPDPTIVRVVESQMSRPVLRGALGVPASAEEHALTERLLQMISAGEGRDYLRASLEGRVGTISRPTITGNPAAAALLDSVLILRDARLAQTRARQAPPRR